MTATKRKQTMLEKSMILSRTHGGLDVFTHYFGKECLGKVFRNPYRQDSRPSCHLRLLQGRDGESKFYMKDFGDSSWSGDCFAITARINNLNFKDSFGEVLDVINQEMSLGLSAVDRKVSTVKVKPVSVITDIHERYSERSIERFVAHYKSFTPHELSYWYQYGITMETLVRFHVESVESVVFYRHDGTDFSVNGSQLMPCFAYVFGDGEGLKIYRPNSPGRFMYAGKLPKPYVFGWNLWCGSLMPETVFVTGGEKDVMSLSAHGFNAIALNSETACVDDNILNRLLEHFKRIVFLYDTDETGKKESRAIVGKFKSDYPVYRMELPLPGTKQEKDISDFFKAGYGGQDLIKIKISQE